MEPTVRKFVTVVEEVHIEGVQPLGRPVRVSVAAAVIKNPYAAVYQDDLSLFHNDYSANLGPKLADLAAENLHDAVESFGKAALVGLAGEVQHGSSIIHTRLFGDALRRVAKGAAPVTAAEKHGAAGALIDLSLRGVHDVGTLDGTVVSHLFSWPFVISDAPRPDEIVVIAAVANAGRPDPRVEQ